MTLCDGSLSKQIQGLTLCLPFEVWIWFCFHFCLSLKEICISLQWANSQSRADKMEKVKVLVAQSCLTLCDPMDCSPPGSSVQGILQARILERAAIAFRDLLDPGIKARSPTLQADCVLSKPPGKLSIYTFAFSNVTSFQGRSGVGGVFFFPLFW